MILNKIKYPESQLYSNIIEIYNYKNIFISLGRYINQKRTGIEIIRTDVQRK